MLVIGMLVCFGAYVAGRALARRLLATPGVRVLSKDAEPAYFEAPGAARLAWRAAGPVAAYALCVALAFLSARASGVTVQTNQVDVIPGGRADAAGMQPGDRIVAVSGVPTNSFHDVQAAVIAVGPDHAVHMTVRRGGAELPIDVTTNAQGHLGIIATTETTPMPLGSALGGAVVQPLVAGPRAAWSFLTVKEKAELSGPIGITRQVAREPERPGRHLAFVLMLLALPSALAWPLTLFLEVALGPRGRRAAG